MQVILDDIDAVADPELRELLQQRLKDIEPYAMSELGYFLIMEAGDSIKPIDAQLGFGIMANRWTGTQYGEPDFSPSWEVIQSHHAWYEMVFVLSDDGSGITIFVSKQCAILDLLAMCQRYA